MQEGVSSKRYGPIAATNRMYKVLIICIVKSGIRREFSLLIFPYSGFHPVAVACVLRILFCESGEADVLIRQTCSPSVVQSGSGELETV
jgi:hypothetical protein